MTRFISAVVAAGLSFCLAGGVYGGQKEEADQMVSEIQSQIDSGNVGQAVKLMKQALKKDPSDWKLWNDLGNIQMAQGELGDARDSFNSALAADPMQAMTRSNMGVLAMKEKNWDAAMKDLLLAIELDPGYAAASYNLGMLMQASGNQESALKHFTKVLESDPGHPGALFAMARIERAAGNSEKALSYYGKGLLKNVDYVEGQIELAIYHFELGNREAAEELLRHCVRRHPGDARAYYALGLFLRDTGNLEESARSLKQAVQLDDKNTKYCIDLALVLLYQTGRKDPGPGEVYIKRALDAAPKDGSTVFMSAIFYDDAGLLEKALKLYGKSVDLGYKAVQSKIYIAEALLKLERKKDAVKVIAELETGVAANDPLRPEVEKLKAQLN